MIKNGKIILWICGLFILNQTLLIAQNSGENPGNVHFEVSCNDEGNSYFTDGLTMLHHMMYDQAYNIFKESIKADPNCAMAYWGVAMTQFNPLWAPPDEQMFQDGYEAIKMARDVGAGTQKEEYHIRALYSYYETADKQSYREGVKAWERTLEEIYNQHSEDVEAGAFYGLSMLATAPADDETFSKKKRSGEMMEQLLELSPTHPGLFHYIIHAYDNPVLADKGVEFARGYEKLAPDVPHALHMPSHIFVRIGNWDETIAWNRRSADAALRQPVENMTSMHHAHALDYMMYGFLQKGEDGAASEVLDELMSIDNYQPHFGAAYGVAAARARYVLEQNDWEGAAQLDPRPDSGFDWDLFSQYEAIGWWAKGLGSAKIGNLDDARRAADVLEELHQKTVENGEDYWALLVDVQQKTVQAWILFEEGKFDDSLALMKEAADMEDSVDKHPVTPGEVLPARELLGDMFILLDEPKEALSAYENTLEISPNRFNSLYGAGNAAEMIGDSDLAATYYESLLLFVNTEKSNRPQLSSVNRFFAGR
jgi:tetratricopeptide (TPR) repeat protein